jgi:hypothetical protein
VTTDPLRHTKEEFTEETNKDDKHTPSPILGAGHRCSNESARTPQFDISIEMLQINYFKFENNFHYVGFEVLTPVVMKSSIFCDITLCSPLKSADVSEERVASTFRVSIYSSSCHIISCWFLAWLILRT